MANGSMSSNSNGEGDIRAQIVEADLVSCMIALPTQLFRSTGIPVCLWFFAKDKTPGTHGSIDRTGQVLFIDARELGYMADRAERTLTNEEIVRIGDTYRSWRGSASAADKGEVYGDVTGFCKSMTLAEIKAADYVLTPGRYVDAADRKADREPVDKKIARLTKDLLVAFEESSRLEAVVRSQLERIDV
jgi:type I restriction enzyme M protein